MCFEYKSNSRAEDWQGHLPEQHQVLYPVGHLGGSPDSVADVLLARRQKGAGLPPRKLLQFPTENDASSTNLSSNIIVVLIVPLGKALREQRERNTIS